MCARNTKAPKYLHLLYVRHGFLSLIPTGWRRQLLSSVLHSSPPTSPHPHNHNGALKELEVLFFQYLKEIAVMNKRGAFTAEFSRQPSSTRMRQPLRIFFLARRQWWQCQAPWLKLLKRGIRVALIAQVFYCMEYCCPYFKN